MVADKTKALLCLHGCCVGDSSSCSLLSVLGAASESCMVADRTKALLYLLGCCVGDRSAQN